MKSPESINFSVTPHCNARGAKHAKVAHTGHKFIEQPARVVALLRAGKVKVIEQQEEGLPVRAQPRVEVSALVHAKPQVERMHDALKRGLDRRASAQFHADGGHGRAGHSATRGERQGGLADAVRTGYRDDTTPDSDEVRKVVKLSSATDEEGITAGEL